MGKPTTEIPFIPKLVRYEIFAICTNLNVFQFCATINSLFSINLQGQKHIPLELQGKVVEPSHYSSSKPNDNVTITVVENQVDGQPLVDFLKNISYFVKISPIVTESQIEDFRKVLSSTENFTFVQRVAQLNFTKQQETTLNTIFQRI